MKWPDPGYGPARIANRMLAGHEWATAKLAAVANRTFSLTVGPLAAAWRIEADGRLSAAPPDATPDLRLTLSPLSVPAFLADPSRWNEFMHEEGDADLGGVLKDLARTLPWFVEETFARALGPVAGQRVADAGRRLLGLPEYAAQRFSTSVASYARDEAGLAATGRDFRAWQQDVAEVAARVDALAPRVHPIR